MRRLLALAILGSVLAGCASRTPDVPGGGAGDQGIEGVVLAGPACPVESAESPCPPKPLPDIRVQVSSGGDVVAEATTDRDGRFSVAVDPGTYDVQAMPGQQGFMSSRPVRVVVRAGAVSEVTVPVDTGIR